MDGACDGSGLCAGGRTSVPLPDSCPVIDNSLYFNAAIQGVVVSGDTVYLEALSEGVRVVDISDPSAPFEQFPFDPPTCFDSEGGTDVPFVAEEVVVSGSSLLVSAGSCGVLVINGSVAWIDTDGWAFSAKSAGDVLFAAVNDSGVALLDEMTEMQIESYDANGLLAGSVDIERFGDRTIVATGSGMAIIEDDVLLGLGIVGVYASGNEGPGSSQDVEFTREGGTNLAYLVRLMDGLDVLDISDPSNIMLLANVPRAPGSTTGSYEVSISGARAVTAEGDGGIGVLDVSDRTSPQSLGAFPSEGFTLDVEMSGGFAFVGFETDPLGNGGLRIGKLERIGVDPLLVPEPETLFGSLAAFAVIGALMWRRRHERG